MSYVRLVWARRSRLPHCCKPNMICGYIFGILLPTCNSCGTAHVQAQHYMMPHAWTRVHRRTENRSSRHFLYHFANTTPTPLHPTPSLPTQPPTPQRSDFPSFKLTASLHEFCHPSLTSQLVTLPQCTVNEVQSCSKSSARQNGSHLIAYVPSTTSTPSPLPDSCSHPNRIVSSSAGIWYPSNRR